MNKSVEPLRRSKRLKEKLEETNLTFDWDKEHPLLNGLILENIFIYWKGKSSELAPLRVVCETWNREIERMQRKETQINLAKLVARYPSGMGWTSSPKNLEAPFYYKTPYPEVRSFQNIILTANLCENLKSEKWISWFQVMGVQVKCLQFSASFACFCQNQFLERILKEWCPNLESLDLRNVKCLVSLLFVSSFSQITKGFKCTGLKDLRISVDGDEDFSICKNKVSTVNTLKVLDIKIRKLCMKLSTWKIVEFIYDYGLDPSNLKPFPEIVNAAGKKITLPVCLNRNQNLPDLSSYFLESLKPTDGGIIGQIMKEINLEKFVFDGLDDLNQGQDLVTFFHVRPNNLRKSLKHLELNDFLSKSFKELDVIGQVRFPLSVIKLGGIHLKGDNAKMTKFLGYYVETLEHLEISGHSVQEEVLGVPSELILPRLPKLKTFVHENIVSCRLSAENLWKNAPNLKTCHLKGSSGDWDAKIFFESSSKISSMIMRDLKLAAPISGKQAEMILTWFPNLVKIELVLDRLGDPANKFFGKMGKSKVEQLKIGFIRHKLNGKGAAPWKKINIGGLKSLEIHNMSSSPFRLTAKPFAKGQLTSLKLTNFWIPGEEKQMLDDLSHIPSVKLEMVNMM